MLSKSLFVIAAVAIAVNAQSSSGSAPAIPSVVGPSTCVLGCVEPAARLNNCTSYADLPCVCGSSQYYIDALLCLDEHCPNEYEAALYLQATACNAYTGSVSTPTAAPFPRTGIYSSYGASATGTAPYSSGYGSSGSARPTSSPSPTPSTSTGTTFQAGVGAFFGAIFAAVAAAAL